MSKRQREKAVATPAQLWLPTELWPQILQHLLAKRGTALADAEWILNWLATHRGAAKLMGCHLWVWLRAVFASNWKCVTRFTRRTHFMPKLMLKILADNCAENERIQRELVYLLTIAQREDDLIYSCGGVYHLEGYCTKGHDISGDAHLCNTYFAHENRLYPLNNAHVKQMLPAGDTALNDAMLAIPPAVAFLCRRGLGHKSLTHFEADALKWELLGEKARQLDAQPHTPLAHIVVNGTPLFSPHSEAMQNTRKLLYHHRAGNMSDEQRHAGLALWRDDSKRIHVMMKRLEELAKPFTIAYDNIIKPRFFESDDDDDEPTHYEDDDESSYSSSLLDDTLSSDETPDESSDETPDESSETDYDAISIDDDKRAKMDAIWAHAPHSMVYDDSDYSESG